MQPPYLLLNYTVLREILGKANPKIIFWMLANGVDYSQQPYQLNNRQPQFYLSLGATNPAILEELDIGIRVLADNLEALFDFKIDVAEIIVPEETVTTMATSNPPEENIANSPQVKPLVMKVKGTFEIKAAEGYVVSLVDFKNYSITVDYFDKAGANLPSVSYNWDKAAAPKENSIAFDFGDMLVDADNLSVVTITSKATDGGVVFSNSYTAVNFDEMQSIEIVVFISRPQILTAPDASKLIDPNKRLRGQLLEFSGKCPLKDTVIIIQAKTAENGEWITVSAGKTDNGGNFSIGYPYGAFSAAQAIVSLAPKAPVPVHIMEPKPRENISISDDFLYLLLNDVDCVHKADEDCDCHDPKKASRLPDQLDLIHSDNYTQDIGGSCVNLSTPNRSLNEKTYYAIVRTTDPSVSRYTLSNNDLVENIQQAGSLTKSAEPHLPTSSFAEREQGLSFKISNKLNPAVGNVTESISPATNTPVEKSNIASVVSHVETMKMRLPSWGMGIQRNIFAPLERMEVSRTNPIRWCDDEDGKKNIVLYQAESIAHGHLLTYKSVIKADGYSMGELLYSLPLAPGQKKQIVIFDQNHSLKGSENQNLVQQDAVAANLINERSIMDSSGGHISESTRGGSTASTGGVSAGLGLGFLAGGFGGVLGVSGGYSSSDASAWQDSSRDLSISFGEVLRDGITQNAQDYRAMNATVVTTVNENQQYAASTEVVANHNHCHSLTMMYFEVLRHYAVYQELAAVSECLFVPLLMTHFTSDNIYKWRDILALNLLPLPSETYLQPRSGEHPLLKGFDANERARSGWPTGNYPDGAYDEDPITDISGDLWLKVRIDIPQLPTDSILSFPIDAHQMSIPSGEFTTLISSIYYWFSINTNLGPKFTIRPNYRLGQPISKFIQLNGSAFDVGFFDSLPIDQQLLWDAIAILCGYGDKVTLFKSRFCDQCVIADLPHLFNSLIANSVFNKFDKLKFDVFEPDISIDEKYKGNEQLMHVHISSASWTGTLSRKDIKALNISIDLAGQLNQTQKDIVSDNLVIELQQINLYYSTAFFRGTLYSGYRGDDLLDGARIVTPENAEEKRNPRKEDLYIQAKLIEHLNANVEHYNKAVWRGIDPDRRFMLLDGFNISVPKLNDDGTIHTNDNGDPMQTMRSLASVVKNQLIGFAGNSLIFPVAEGYKLDPTYLQSQNEYETDASGNYVLDASGKKIKVPSKSLLEHYTPETPPPPFRISIPSKGVFAEAVMGACDACEKIEEDRAQDWTKFTADEPTAINPVTPPTPTVTDWQAAFKDFATPIVNIQNAPSMPAPGAGLSTASELLGKSDLFKDITGLDQTQKNAMQTYLSNQENAKAFAEMAKEMAMQAHNTQNSDKIKQSLQEAKDSGAITAQEHSDLTKQHLGQQIDGGQSAKAAADAVTSAGNDIMKTASDAINRGQTVKASQTDADGNTKSVDILGTMALDGATDGSTDSSESGTGAPKLKYDFTVPGTISPLSQQTPDDCWAAVITMMNNWKSQTSTAVADFVALLGDDYTNYLQNGISIEKLNDLFKKLGLNAIVANECFSIDAFYSVLQKNGPIWIIDLESSNPEELHGRILKGIKGDGGPTTSFSIIDPNNENQNGEYEEDGVIFNQKCENVFKTIEEVKKNTGNDVQLPAYIYFSDIYDQSSLVGGTTGGSGVVVGGSGTGTNGINSPDSFIPASVRSSLSPEDLPISIVQGGIIMDAFYLQKKEGAPGRSQHLGIDVSKTADKKIDLGGFNDNRRGLPVYAAINHELKIDDLLSVQTVRVTQSGTYIEDEMTVGPIKKQDYGIGVPISALGTATLKTIYAVPQPWQSNEDSSYGGIIGLSCIYGINDLEFTIYIEFLHLITKTFMPKNSSGKICPLESWMSLNRGYGFGPVVDGLTKKAHELNKFYIPPISYPLIGFLGATQTPHTHIQARYFAGKSLERGGGLLINPSIIIKQ